ncbi:MAG: ABC transporter ATP-binding protein, partial [Rhizomicrobium sp.]
MIEIEQVSKKFGAIAAVSDLSFTAVKGEVLGFLGPNGAGKSTTMKMVAGFLRADSGHIRVCGLDVQTRTRAAQSLIGYLPEGAPAYGDMTVRGFLRFIAEARGMGVHRRNRLDAVIEQTGLATVL